MIEYVRKDDVLKITAETGTLETQSRVKELPAADVREVRHGHWIDKGVLENYPKPDVNVYHLLWCSECGALHRARPHCEGGWINSNLCPNCGAQMDGETQTERR